MGPCTPPHPYAPLRTPTHPSHPSAPLSTLCVFRLLFAVAPSVTIGHLKPCGLNAFHGFTDASRRHRRQGPFAPGGPEPADGLARPAWAPRRTRSSRRRTGCRPSRRRSRRIPRAPTTGCCAALAARGIDQLYTHQAEAFGHVLAGRNVVTITPTASGKTLCYNAPVLNAILQDPVDARALPVSDQGARAGPARRAARAVRARDARHATCEIGVFTYDGDTPSDARRAIRGKAHVVLSNPDMVHSGILPHHPRWAKLFENLQVRHHRRAARVSRRVRQPPRQHPAAAAAHLPALRIGSGLHLLVGDDRQPAGAGRRADRPAVRARRAERRAARREVLPVREPAGRERAARHPPVVPGRGAPRRDRVPAGTTCS